MNLLGRKKDDSRPEESRSAAATADQDVVLVDGVRTTAPKGKPTPKRDASRRRGPVAPAPMTSAEARKRRKEIGGPKLSKEERRADKAARRSAMSERREKMMSGEESYLLPRDKGPVRRLARDVVDSRRNVLGLFMPAALGLVFIMLAVPSVEVQRLLSPAMLALVVVMVIDGVIVGRRVNKTVDAKYPENVESGWKLGFYAASRASQIRRMRAPRPMVNRGDEIA